MRRSLLLTAGIIMVTGVASATAQTLYNSPGTDGSAVFDFGRLFPQRDTQAAAPANRYTATPDNAPSSQSLSQQRRIALNQWREQRDNQAVLQQQRSLEEMAALSEAVAMGYYSPAATPAIPGATSQPPAARQQVAPVAPVYVGPMIFDKNDNEGIQTPRRLFNTVE